MRIEVQKKYEGCWEAEITLQYKKTILHFSRSFDNEDDARIWADEFTSALANVKLSYDVNFTGAVSTKGM